MGVMARVGRLALRAATEGWLPVPSAAALGALILVSRQRSRHKLRSIRRLEIENLRYYRRGIAAGHDAVWTSLYSPVELFKGFGLSPLCLEGVAGLLAAGGVEQPFLDRSAGEAVPSTLCTFHRAIVGVGGSKLLPRPRLVVSASALCDGNAVSFRLLAERHELPFIFLDIPAEPTPAAISYLVEQLHAVVAALGGITGRPIDTHRLSQAVARSRDAARLARRLFLRRGGLDRNLFRAPQMINMMFALNAMAGTRGLCETLEMLNRDTDDPATWCTDFPAAHTGPSAARLLWTHIAPLYNYNMVWSVIDDGRRAKVVSEECSHWDDVELDCADEVEFIARRLIGVPQNGPLERRLERIERLRRESGADAVIHFSHWGCHQAAGAVPLMQRFFNERGVPFLNLNGDCVDSSGASREQHVTRCEAFVESVARRTGIARNGNG